jgi:2-polyprenyl-3-methyl-5-hydroxy-6-metoxy-1,4-benzoquinol methylase
MAEWFETWFDSVYYHLLYASRSEEEAQWFIKELIEKVGADPSWECCDLACGKGRHSRSLYNLGMKVTGLDLSPNSIQFAKKFENERLGFFIHDMRNVYKHEHFDWVLNLFTSFGYFESQAENQKALVSTAASIKPGGLLVLDYMNSKLAIESFQKHYVKESGGVAFKINKYIEKGYIYKDIHFKVQDKTYAFTERVKLLFLEDFKTFFKAADLEIKEVWGNYALEKYDLNQSPRMIFLCQKPL